MRKFFEEIIVENFPNMEKERANQVQEAQRVPYRTSPRRNMPRHIRIKLTKTKHKERILKEAREKQEVTCKGNSQSSPRGSKNPIQDKHKEKHAKTHTN